MDALIAFWSHALAAALFAALMIWRLRDAARQPGQRLLAGAFALTACWAWLSAMTPGSPLVGYAESARNLVWIGLLYSLSAAGEERQHGVRLVYGAVAAVIGMQLVADTLGLVSPGGAIAQTSLILRITTAAGALVLVHNLYGQAAPSSRSHIRLAMLGLAMIWVYDLNLYTVTYLGSPSVPAVREWRGLAVALTAPLFALGARHESGWRIRLSRAATFQSLSLLAICAYFALMAILATALRGSHYDGTAALMIGVLAVMTVGAMVVIPSARVRGWLKVKLAKHLFEHRYDYRSEWLRFTQTLGRAGPEAPPLTERIVKAFADVIDAPGGMLLVSDGGRGVTVAASWNWSCANPPADQLEDCFEFWSRVESGARILEFEGLRSGWASARDKALPVPPWMLVDDNVWAGIPLIHHERMAGLIVLASPEFRRALDWEDFDLLRTAGNQAASSLAEAFGQEALANAQRFEEFNRRFAFILRHQEPRQPAVAARAQRRAPRRQSRVSRRHDRAPAKLGRQDERPARAPVAERAPRGAEPGAATLQPFMSSAIAALPRDHEVQLHSATPAAGGRWSRPPRSGRPSGHLPERDRGRTSEPTDPVTIRVAAHGDSVAVTIVSTMAARNGRRFRS